MRPPVLILPGLFNSGPGHWQTIWESQHPDYRRVQQRDWTTPRCADWARSYSSNRRIHAAFLVAPTDVEAPTFPTGSTGFQPMPMQRLPFRSVVVSSVDDPYVTLHRAEAFATAWGSQFIHLGRAGHINSDSGHGAWPEGEQWLEDLRG